MAVSSTRTEYVIGARDDTAAGVASAKRNLGDLSASTIAKGVAVGNIMAQLSLEFVSGLQRNITQTSQWADALDELTQKTGLTLEAQQSLNYAANIGGASAEKLEVGLKKLAINMSAAAASGDDLTDEAKGAAAAFNAMGLSIEDLRKPTDEVLLTIASKFAGYEDGAKKVALATAVFGKSGADLIPFLNQGKDGIDALRKEAEKLGVVMSGDKVKALAQFNDDLDRLKEASAAASRDIVAFLLPSLGSLASELLAAKKAYGSFWEALKGGAFSGGFFTQAEQLSAANDKLREHEAALKKLQDSKSDFLKMGGLLLLYNKRETQALADVAAAQKLVAYNSDLVNQSVKKRVNPTDLIGASPTVKTKAPSIATGGKPAAKTDNDDPAKKELEGYLKTLESALANERDQIAFQLQYMAGVRDQDLVNLQDYDAFKLDAINRSRDAQIAAYEAEIAALESYRSKQKKLSEQQDASNKIAELQSKISAAQREANQATTLTIQAQGKAQADLTKVLNEYTNQLTLARADMVFEASLYGKTALEVKNLTDERKIQLDVESKIAALRKQYGADANVSGLQDLADSQKNIVRDTNNAAAQKADDPWAAASESLRKYGEQAQQTGQQIGDVMTRAMGGAEDAFVQFVMTGKSSFSDLAKSIIADLIRIQIRKMVAGVIGAITGTGGYSLAGRGDTQGFADGGRPPTNRPSLIGERGPELFIPDSAGTIIPNHQLGGGASINYAPIINIDSRSDQAQIREMVDLSVKRGNADLVNQLQRGRRI